MVLMMEGRAEDGAMLLPDLYFFRHRNALRHWEMSWADGRRAFRMLWIPVQAVGIIFFSF